MQIMQTSARGRLLRSWLTLLALIICFLVPVSAQEAAQGLLRMFKKKLKLIACVSLPA